MVSGRQQTDSTQGQDSTYASCAMTQQLYQLRHYAAQLPFGIRTEFVVLF